MWTLWECGSDVNTGTFGVGCASAKSNGLDSVITTGFCYHNGTWWSSPSRTAQKGVILGGIQVIEEGWEGLGKGQN